MSDKRIFATLLLAVAQLLPLGAHATPQTVQTQYEITLNGAKVGVMQEALEIRDSRYRILSETHATGVLALVQRRPARAESHGEIIDKGLRPLTFDGVRGNNESRRVRAEFDWNAKALTLTHDGRSETLALPAGTQDRLSAMYQFLFLTPDRLRALAFAMTNGRKLDQYRYAIGTDTAIDTPLGRFEVIHLVKARAPTDTATEIWLARDHRLIPVKMRIIEDDGTRYEQIISRLDMTPESP